MQLWVLLLVCCSFLSKVHGRVSFRTLTHFGFVPVENFNNDSVAKVDECPNGVCMMKNVTNVDDSLGDSNPGDASTQVLEVDNQENVNELQKLGWSKEEAILALNVTENDVADAATFLEQQQEEAETRQLLVTDLEKRGWVADAAAAALRESKNNITLAESFLELEEETIQSNFELAVEEMIGSGWDEIVARQSLLAQWTLDQRKAAGLNNTIDEKVLKSIKPTLKKRNETVASTPAPAPKPPASPSPAAPPKKDPPAPKPARKEDVVFDVTASNFQKVVLESPVPVLLDVYADWCGPCKQLGPILEDAAVRAGGLFRLAKLNSEAERSFVETLQVKGLPSVYAVVKGRITDRFVGMLPGEQIQQFLIRAIMGTGKRVQPNDELQEKDFADITKSILSLAGLASLDGKKKAKLLVLLNNILQVPEVYAKDSNGQWTMHPSIKAALRYVENAHTDIMNPKFRTILKTNKVYQEKIATYEPAEKLLQLAGFRGVAGDNDKLELVHKNAAILNLILQRIHSFCQETKYAKMKQTVGSLPARETLVPVKSKQSAREKVLEAMKTPSSVPAASTPSTSGKTVAATEKSPKTITSSSAEPQRKKKLFKQILQEQKKTEAPEHNEYFGGGSTVVLAGENKQKEAEEKKADEEVASSKQSKASKLSQKKNRHRKP